MYLNFCLQVQNAAGCQLLCYHKSICQFWSWWSGDILSNICVFHKDCERLHLDCEHCFAGPKIPPPTGCHPTLYSNVSSPVFDDTTSSIIFGVACANVAIAIMGFVLFCFFAYLYFKDDCLRSSVKTQPPQKLTTTPHRPTPPRQPCPSASSPCILELIPLTMVTVQEEEQHAYEAELDTAKP